MQVNNDDAPRVPRHPGRRYDDLTGMFRHAWFRKLVAWTVAALGPVAVYFWNESRTALGDIEGLKHQVDTVKYEQRVINEKLDRAAKLSDQQRADIKTDVIRVENKVERLDESIDDLRRQLSGWFQKAGREK